MGGGDTMKDSVVGACYTTFGRCFTPHCTLKHDLESKFYVMYILSQ